MPTYVYKCKACEYVEEHEFPIGKAPETLGTCPECESWVKKVILPAAVSFKGGGFYSTDSRKKHISKQIKVRSK